MKLTRKKGPLYTQIKNILKDRILHGIYPIDSNIPAEPQLEKEFYVSKITVRKAIEELAHDGFVEKKSGKGTRVIRNRSSSKLSKGKLFTEFLVESGHKLNKELLEIIQLTNEKDSNLYRLFGTHCICIKRLYHLDGQPYIYYHHYLSMEVEAIKQEDIKEQSLYEFVEQRGIDLEKFTDKFTVAIATTEAQQALKLDANTTLLKRTRYAYDETNNLIEYSEGYYNNEIQEYVLNYEK
ncbi:GntR family transcriptional regulator [Radiobacillus sp. PE A8.2]|uniref:GntR family transcriptional regulator n=1 Tax=Radiobacillus sp. PE A8.2 TaxID=3380349 RepID=UPI00388EA30F